MRETLQYSKWCLKVVLKMSFTITKIWRWVGLGKFMKNDRSSKSDGDILEVEEWVLVWNGVSILSAIISAWSPIAVLLRDPVQRTYPTAFGWSYHPKLKHMVKLCPSNLELLQTQTA